MSAFTKIRNGLRFALGLERMTNELKVFSSMYLAFLVATTFAGIFINVFLFNVSGAMSTLAVYYLCYYISEGVSVYIAVKLSHRVNMSGLTVIGLVLHVIAYGLLLITREGAIHIYPIIAILCGCGGGFFWMSYYALLQAYTDESNRQYGVTFIGMFASAISLVAPLISGTILVSVMGIAGYVAVFAVALVFFLISIVFALRMKIPESSTGKKEMLMTMRSMWKKKALNRLLVCEGMSNLKVGVYAFYLSILIYSLTSNELALGMSSTLSGAATLLANYVLNRIDLKHRTRIAVMLIAMMIMVAATGMLFFWYGAIAVIAYYILYNCGESVSNTFKICVCCEVTEYTSEACGCDRNTEVGALRIIASEVGRCIGIFISFLVPEGSITWILIFFVGLNLVNLGMGFVYKNASRICSKGAVSQ